MYNIYRRWRKYLYERVFGVKSETRSERVRYFSTFVKKPVTSLLDLGCGNGFLFKYLLASEETSLMVGIDLKKGGNPMYQHVEADAAKLPFKGSTFSVITAFSLIEHIPRKNRGRFYRDVRRTIKKGGRFVVQLPNRYALVESHTFLPLFGFLPARIHSFAYRGEYYVSVPSLKEVISSLNKNRFKIVSIEKYGAPFLPFGNFLWRIGLFRLFPMGYVIHAFAKNHGINS